MLKILEQIKNSHGDISIYSSDDLEETDLDDIRVLFSSDGHIVVID